MRDVIADKIGALIASGLLSVGDALPGERELASALSVSRQTVRGAIQILAAHGILDVTQGARTRVARAELGGLSIGITAQINVDRYDVHAVHAARMLVEQQIVGDAAQRISQTRLRACGFRSQRRLPASMIPSASSSATASFMSPSIANAETRCSQTSSPISTPI